MTDSKIRCGWCTSDAAYIQYHDSEWGVAQHDDTHLFEMLILEGAQAGLSWLTILRKREAYRKAFAGFNPRKVAKFGRDDIARLLGNAGIVRNRLKIESAIRNAQVFLSIQKEHGSFDAYLWEFVGKKQKKNNPKTLMDIPARTELSDEISADLKKRGMNFVGSTIIYAYLQAVGVVDDHIASCWKRR